MCVGSGCAETDCYRGVDFGAVIFSVYVVRGRVWDVVDFVSENCLVCFVLVV